MEDRRHFLRKLAASGAALGTAAGVARAQNAETASGAKVDRRLLGSTGERTSLIGLGLGSNFTRPFGGKPDEARVILERALELGINYLDTARAYGSSEATVGPTVADHRQRIFLVSKSGERGYDAFKRELETSLNNLQTDHLDLYHLHNFDPKKDTDLDAIENGAVRAAREAREQGVIRNFGITGHSGPDILMEGMRRWQPDVVMTTFPADRPENGRYEDELLPLGRDLGIGIVAMKTVRWARNSDLPGTQLVRYALSLDGITTAVVGLDSIAHLDENAAMTTGFTPLSQELLAEMRGIVRDSVASIGPAPWQRPGYQDRSLV